jgi:hypothetical protein
VRNRNRTLSEETTQIAGMTVTIVRKAIKNMYLRIKPPNAQIVISAPSRMSQAAIARFVTERKPWIERARRTMLQAKDEQIRQSDFNGLDRVNGSHGPDNLNGLENSVGVGDRNNPGDPNSLNFRVERRGEGTGRTGHQCATAGAACEMVADYRAEADACHVTHHDVAMGVMHAENRPHPTQPATWSYGSQIPGIRACARNDAPVGKRARRGLSAAYERIFAAMEAIAAGAEPSCCVVMLAMLLRSPSRCHAAMSLRRAMLLRCL